MNRGERILVTGASGFIGSHLADHFLAAGFRARCLLRPTSSRRYLPNGKFETAIGRLSEPESLRKAVKGADWIVHCAGATYCRCEEDYFAVNLTGTANLLRAAVEAAPDLKGFIYLSSLSAAGPAPGGRPLTEDDPPAPVSYYGRSKLSGEEEAKKFAGAFPVTVLRPAAVYGPRERELFEIIRLVGRGWSIHPGLRDIHLSLIYVSDLAEVVTAALKPRREGLRLYYLADGRHYRSGELLALARELIGRRTLRIRIPLGLAAGAGGLAARLRPDAGCAFYLDKLKEMRHNYWLCDIAKARRELDFSPRYDLRRGMTAAIEWYRREGWLK